ncbi:hypothetical protein [Negadavirga shengliensis]|uniref:Uncharacterized protein n=1 Tax=Negadavirga shengliensis TaxID=1389218 RepID=A0ABV9T0U5_9BACT
MKNIYQHIEELTVKQWHYYYGLNENLEADKPFIDNSDYSNFILNYFKKGGKVEIFKSCKINVADLRLPNHICSVFFLGVLMYYNTSFHKKYKLVNSDPGYRSFPFIWFLIALFHDNAYQMEDKNELKNISNISELIEKFEIEHSLFDRKFSKCKELLHVRNNYFLFRKKKWNVVDHGILGGMLLFDRLIKIRRRKKQLNEDNLFWGKRLENQYKTAANAISIHNIWIQPEDTCKQFDMEELIGLKPIQFSEFPLFYILGIVDTIEPLKTYYDDGVSDIDIFKSLDFEFGKNFLRVQENRNSKVDFRKLVDKTKYFKNWLDLEVKVSNTEFKLTFK